MLGISSYSMLGNPGRQHTMLFLCGSEECTGTSYFSRMLNKLAFWQANRLRRGWTSKVRCMDMVLCCEFAVISDHVLLQLIRETW